MAVPGRAGHEAQLDLWPKQGAAVLHGGHARRVAPPLRPLIGVRDVHQQPTHAVHAVGAPAQQDALDGVHPPVAQPTEWGLEVEQGIKECCVTGCLVQDRNGAARD